MHALAEPLEFQWDTGNSGKNLKKHRVADTECEEVFFDENKKVLNDVLHSEAENRYLLIGMTQLGRLLLVVFTIRKEKIRIISARDLNRKERNLYA